MTNDINKTRRMYNEINKTGMMYVVWPANPEVKSSQDGIDKMIESIERTRAQYHWCEEGIAEIVYRDARENADQAFEDSPKYSPYRGIDRESEEWKKAMVGRGSRAIYEVRIRYVGKVDAQGRFTETKPKTKRKRR